MAISLGKYFSDNENSNNLNFGLKIVRPTSFEEGSKKIAELIREGNIVAFSLENLPTDISQRTYDFVLGATVVLGGKIEKISDKVFASIPASINVEEVEEITEK